MGSVYHSNNVDSGGFTNSNIKGMMSRKGSNLTFDDAEHALMLATSLSNMIHVHEGEGTITASAANIITLQSAAPAKGKDAANSLIINSTKNTVDIKATQKISLTVGQSSLTMDTDGNIEIKGVTIKITGTTSVETNGGTVTANAKEKHSITGTPVDIN
jgi:hypothetical protein